MDKILKCNRNAGAWLCILKALHSKKKLSYERKTLQYQQLGSYNGDNHSAVFE